MEVRNNGSYGVVIAYDPANRGRGLLISQDEAITLRDLLLREFPIMRPCKCQVTQVPVVDKERRERIATAVLQGLLTRCPWSQVSAAESAVDYADALIAALDK